MSDTTTDLPAPEHLSPERMNHYAFRALDADALLAADDHLTVCPECRAHMVDEAGLRATVRSLGREIGAARRPDPDHMAYEAIEALAEERMRGPAREVADLHVEGCATCAGEVSDLRGFVAAHRAARRAAATATAAALMGGSATDAGAAAARPVAARASAGAGAAGSGTAAAAAITAAAHGPGLSDTLLTLPSARRTRARSWAPMAAAIIATLLLAAGGVWFATRELRSERDALARRVQELGEQNSALATRADEVTRTRADIERQAAAAALESARPSALTLQDRRGREGTVPVGLDDDGQLVGLDSLTLADARTVAVALRRGAIEIPADVLALVRDDGGAAPGPVLVAPVGVAVRGVRPTFAWQPQQGATAYTLEILDDGGAVAMRGGPTRSAKWTPPRSLRRGGRYAWSVAAALPGDPVEAAPAAGAPAAAGDAAASGPAAEETRALTVVSARGRFRVLDADAAAALERSLRAASGSRLAAGVFYARAGLLDEAIVELRALSEANRDSDMVRSLLASVETAHTAR